MDPFLRKINHPQASGNYPIMLKDDGQETKLGFHPARTHLSNAARPEFTRKTGFLG
jgi:hypothetical protein